MAGDGSGMAYPVRPSDAATSALRPLEEELSRLRKAAGGIRAAVEAYEPAYARSRVEGVPQFTVIRGESAANAALEKAAGACREELITTEPGGGRPAALLEEALGRSLRLTARGVRQRTLYQHTVRSHRPTLSSIRQANSAGAEIRTVAEVFGHLIVCDRDVAFIPLSEDTAGGTLEVRCAALIRYLTVVFEHSWAQATPLDDGAGADQPALVIDDLQRAILRAVVSGETDERIARRLGMSRRTVVEHVRRVAGALGSRSRAQLSYLLGRSRLLDDCGDDDAPPARPGTLRPPVGRPSARGT